PDHDLYGRRARHRALARFSNHHTNLKFKFQWDWTAAGWEVLRIGLVSNGLIHPPPRLSSSRRALTHLTTYLQAHKNTQDLHGSKAEGSAVELDWRCDIEIWLDSPTTIRPLQSRLVSEMGKRRGRECCVGGWTYRTSSRPGWDTPSPSPSPSTSRHAPTLGSRLQRPHPANVKQGATAGRQAARAARAPGAHRFSLPFRTSVALSHPRSPDLAPREGWGKRLGAARRQRSHHHASLLLSHPRSLLAIYPPSTRELPKYELRVVRHPHRAVAKQERRHANHKPHGRRQDLGCTGTGADFLSFHSPAVLSPFRSPDLAPRRGQGKRLGAARGRGWPPLLVSSHFRFHFHLHTLDLALLADATPRRHGWLLASTIAPREVAKQEGMDCALSRPNDLKTRSTKIAGMRSRRRVAGGAGGSAIAMTCGVSGGFETLRDGVASALSRTLTTPFQPARTIPRTFYESTPPFMARRRLATPSSTPVREGTIGQHHEQEVAERRRRRQRELWLLLVGSVASGGRAAPPRRQRSRRRGAGCTGGSWVRPSSCGRSSPWWAIHNDVGAACVVPGGFERVRVGVARGAVGQPHHPTITHEDDFRSSSRTSYGPSPPSEA
ncbi:hypothetical protein CVT26_000666, partial [Gymnopilus dilepis]